MCEQSVALEINNTEGAMTKTTKYRLKTKMKAWYTCHIEWLHK